MNIRNIAQQVINLEAKTISMLNNSITEDLLQTVQLIWTSTGRLVVTGIGKSALVGQKIVATFNSTGTPSLFMHAADAIHGDFGMIGPNDVIMIISKSGETPELKRLLPLFNENGNKIIAMVSNQNSSVAKQSDFILHTPIEQEADPFDLIPTASIISQSAMGDVLAMCLLHQRGFTENHFAKFHPGGMIGKTLLMKVKDLSSQNQRPMVEINDDLEKIIIEISEKRLGATAVLDNGELVGVITDGDLRRMLQKKKDLNIVAKDLMSSHPKSLSPDALVTEALKLMTEENISQLLVYSEGEYHGMIHLHDILKEGF